MNELSEIERASKNVAERRAFFLASRAARAAAVMSAALLLTAGGEARAQSETPRIAAEVEAKEKQQQEKEPNRPANAQPKQQNSKRNQSVPRSTGQPLLEVVIKTDIPQSEIFLSRGGMGMEKLGRTNNDGKLIIHLPPGKHEIVASRQGARILRQQIKVEPDNTSFSFNLALPVPVKKQQDEIAGAAPVEEAKPSEPAKPPVNPDEVVSRFINAKGDEPTADDWKQVQAQAAAALVKEADNKQLMSQSLLAEGQVAYLRGDFPTALISFKKAVLANPDYAAAQYGLGNAYLATNQPEEALNAYSRAVTLNKDLAPAYKGAGDALTKLGRKKEATSYFDRAKSLGQTLPTNTSLVEARSLKKRKRWAQAVKEFEDVAASDPSPDVFIDIGDCYVGLEQPLSAAKAYQKATELDPKAALAHYKYGEIMFNLHEYASAMESYERALALDANGTSFNRAKARERADEAAKKLGQKKK